MRLSLNRSMDLFIWSCHKFGQGGKKMQTGVWKKNVRKFVAFLSMRSGSKLLNCVNSTHNFKNIPRIAKIKTKSPFRRKHKREKKRGPSSKLVIRSNITDKWQEGKENRSLSICRGARVGDWSRRIVPWVFDRTNDNYARSIGNSPLPLIFLESLKASFFFFFPFPPFSRIGYGVESEIWNLTNHSWVLRQTCELNMNHIWSLVYWRRDGTLYGEVWGISTSLLGSQDSAVSVVADHRSCWRSWFQYGVLRAVSSNFGVERSHPRSGAPKI